MPGSKKTFVLQAGVNQYHADSSVGALNGAVNDITAMRAWLEAHTPASGLEIVTLKDGEATHQSVVRYFREWLAKEARPGDTVFFEYSGHGSRGTAPDEFKKYFSEGKNETLVLHDSRIPGGYDLADKELAVLLSLLPEGVHAVVMADSCHSGSITRSAELETRGMARWTADSTAPRPIDTFADGYYANQLAQSRRLVIPVRPHISLSACSRHELAYESRENRGFFTSALIEVLDRTGGRISYSDLFVKVRQLLAVQGVKQNPQFEYTAGMSPWLGWLNGAGGGKPRYARVFFDKSNWKIDRGAIHGLQAEGPKETPVFESAQSRTPLGVASLSHLGVQTSTLNVGGLALDEKKEYFGGIPVAPLPVFFGSDFLKGEVKTLFEEKYAASIQAVDQKSAAFQVKKSARGWGVYDTSNQFHFGLETANVAEAAEEILAALEKVAAWNRLLSLENPRSGIRKEDLDFRFYHVDSTTLQEAHVKGDKLEFDFETENGEPKPVWYSLKARNGSQRKLYFTLVYLSQSLEVEVHYQDKSLHDANDPEVTLSDDRGLGIMDPEKQECIDRFLLIASTEPLEAFLFNQTGVEGWGSWRGYDKSKGVMTRSLFKRELPADWQTRLIETRTVRKQAALAGGRYVSGGASIAVGEHPPVEAQISLAGPDQVDPTVRKWMEALPCVTGLGGGAAGRSLRGGVGLLELNQIMGETGELKRPLRLQVPAFLRRDEYLLPIAYDGEHFMPAGLVTDRDRGEVIVEVDELHPDRTRTRSLGKAVKMYFLKVVAEKPGVLLRRVAWTKDGKLLQTEDGVREAVARAERILVVLHGIIGNTADQVAGLRFALDAGKYDLMLSFDYENLGTPISETAATLKELLIGCGAADKGVDLLAHSMGGLVSRWMIEKEGGDVFVHKLYMLGTPNAGSPFSSIAPVLNVLIALAANLAHPGLGGLVAFSQAFGKYRLTRTLADMDKDSAMLNALNRRGDFLTDYFVVAGDVINYQPANDGGFFQNFMNKVLRGAGKAIYRSPNDVAVSVESILNVNQGQPVKSFTIDCNHLVYFSEPNSTNLLRKIM